MEKTTLKKGDRIESGGKIGTIICFASDDPTVPWVQFDEDGMKWDARDLHHYIKLLPQPGEGEGSYQGGEMKVVLVAGDFESGITVWGPFASAGDAETFADKERFCTWEILKLYDPEKY